MSGIRAFEDTDTVEINVLACPMDNVSIAVMEQVGRTCAKINAMGLCDVPAGLNAREAIDWHNGKLPTQDGTRLDNRNVAVYWNWFVMTNRWAETKFVPPTLGVLRAMAYTFNVDKPWYAAAGENRGYLQMAQRVQFDRVSEDTKQAMYGNGNSVNPILKIKGRHYLYGERTMQRSESKLTAVHNVILVNWVVNGMATVARRYVFDPNDAELLIQLKLAFTEFLDRIVNERGIEQYNLVMDDRNNTAETRNNREVIVDLELIPTDVAERIYINAIVRESGAVLNTVG
jgi:phage tail sheath protein FI